MKYANRNIPEPTCEGWWWRRFKKAKLTIELIRLFGDQMKIHCGGNGWTSCHRLKDVTWTGPIPVPSDAEDKPSLGNGDIAHSCPRCGEPYGSVEAKHHDCKAKPPHTDRGKGRPAHIDEHGMVETGDDIEGDIIDEPPEFKCMRCGLTQTRGGWELRGDGGHLCFDCSRDEMRAMQPTPSDEELGYTAMHIINGKISQGFCLFKLEASASAAAEIGAAIRAKLQSEAPKATPSDEEIVDDLRTTAMAFLDCATHAEKWLAAARRIRAKLEDE